MQRFSVALFTGAVAALLIGNQARADNVPWKYNWTPSTLTITASDSPTGSITKLHLTNEPLDADGNPLSNVTVKGNSDIVATALNVESNAPAGFPDEFKTGADITLKLKITDGLSGQAAQFLFTGTFATQDPSEPSTASEENSNVKFTGTGVQKYVQVLGSQATGFREYTIKFVSYTPPPPQGAANKGAIAYNVKIRSLDIQKAPEPSTMLLAGLGASFMGLGAWRKRRQTAQAA